jgi:hypothetical protein
VGRGRNEYRHVSYVLLFVQWIWVRVVELGGEGCSCELCIAFLLSLWLIPEDEKQDGTLLILVTE